jgi:hypothetical protein
MRLSLARLRAISERFDNPYVMTVLLSPAWAGYAACAWALAFSGISFYWAAGGTSGGEAIGPAITKLAHDPAFTAILWSTGALKLVGGVLALALVQPWGRRLPRRLLLAAAWGGGIPIPSGLGHTAALWHVLLWDPWWLLGGILFVLAAWHSRVVRSNSVAHA